MDKQMILARRRWLKAAHMTIGGFARATDEEPGTVYRWFSEGSRPRRRYLASVLRVFKDWPHRKSGA